MCAAEQDEQNRKQLAYIFPAIPYFSIIPDFKQPLNNSRDVFSLLLYALL